jgi:membrane-bound ClpP family serine protease
MPLTHEEREQLKQLERGLSREDPAFAQKIRTGLDDGSFTTSPWNLVLLLVGVLVLLVGIEMQFTPIGVIGFILMGVGAFQMISRPKSFD